jgi:hypothetical protein
VVRWKAEEEKCAGGGVCDFDFDFDFGSLILASNEVEGGTWES